MALEVSRRFGLAGSAILKALSTFPGVCRRMMTHGYDAQRQLLLMEDYAHHPTELDCLFQALKEQAGDRALAIIFQPHRYERIKHYHHQFSEVLSKFDRVILLSPFAAWKTDYDLADPRLLLAEMEEGQGVFWSGDFSQLPEFALQFFPSSQVVIAVVGAGDVTQVVNPLKKVLGF
jgi:UDP-N-acetylmuramate--alanine ligase